MKPMRDKAANRARPYSGEDRRKAPRVKTLRDVVFAALSGVRARRGGRRRPRGLPLLQDGTAVDISRDGIQVHTRRPEAVGTLIDLEIEPKAGETESSVILARGRVVRVTAVAPGEYAMGVHLALPHPSSRPAHARPAPSPSPILAPRGRPLVAVTPVTSGQREQTGARSGASTGDRVARRGLFALSLLLLICFLVLLLMLGPDVPSVSDGKTTAHPGVAKVSREAANRGRGPAIPPSSSASLRDPSHREGSDGALAGTLMPAQATGIGGPAGRVIRGAIPTDHGGPQERPEEQNPPMLATLAPVENGQGPEPPSGPLLLAASVEQPEYAQGEDVDAAISAPQGAGHDLSLTVHVAPPPLDVDPGTREVLLLVDKSTFTLTIFVAGRPVGRFPVGLGANDATPTGEFRIGNKLTSPDWYHRGESVRAGDPRNPLGNRWLGLHDGETLTSYGLHPTDEGGSIGRASSAGCIRLRPEDAETLFRLCPIGTPVRVCSSGHTVSETTASD